jgi:hypothetical protein
VDRVGPASDDVVIDAAGGAVGVVGDIRGEQLGHAIERAHIAFAELVELGRRLHAAEDELEGCVLCSGTV